MKRGLIGVALLLTLGACAKPQTAGGTNGSASPQALKLAACVHASGSETPGPMYSPPAPEPTTSETHSPEQLWQRNQRANKAYRDRSPLSAAVIATNQPCADLVQAGLDRLRAQHKFDAASIEDVLRGVGLDEAIARPAGRLDVAGRGGLLFAGSTGQACVYGEFGPDVTDVQLGSGIADGGCLPAPD